jgi:hypothetical protein
MSVHSRLRSAIVHTMTSKTFNGFPNKAKSKAAKTTDATNVAARYLVYKLYEAATGQPHAVGGVA